MEIRILRIVIQLWMIGLITASAEEATITPSDDAVVATALQPPQVFNGSTLVIRGSGQGVVIFQAPVIKGALSNAVLTLTPYGVPLRGTNVDIYGISEQTGIVSVTDANAGTFLGTLHTDSGLSFDVTTFIATNSSPYVGFSLRTIAGGFNDAIGLDDFTSIESGHPSQLHVAAEQIILPPTIVCPEPLTLECTNGGAVATLQAGVVDAKGLPLEIVWTLDGTPLQTNNIPPGGTITASNVTFTANFEYGEHTVVIVASNGQTVPATCSTVVTVQDTTAPTVLALFAKPDVIWPPNHRMVPVTVTVNTVDNCDSATVAAITQITCNQPEGHSAPDWQITGPLTVDLRAERLANSSRIYTIYVEIADANGNKTNVTTKVVVPKSLAQVSRWAQEIKQHWR